MRPWYCILSQICTVLLNVIIPTLVHSNIEPKYILASYILDFNSRHCFTFIAYRFFYLKIMCAEREGHCPTQRALEAH